MNEFNKKMDEKRIQALRSFLDKVKESNDPQDRKMRRQQLLKMISSLDLSLDDMKTIMNEFDTEISLDGKLRPLDIVNALLPDKEKSDPKRKNDDVELDIINIGETFVPTDGTSRGPQEGKGETPFEQKETIERTKILINFLHENGIQSQQYAILKGKNKPNMMRKESYALVIIPSLESMILVCDEVGNTTFVVRDLPTNPEEYYELTKDELKTHTKVANQINWSKKEGEWQEKILDALTDPNTTFDKKEKTDKKERSGFLTLEKLKEAVKADGVDSEPKYRTEQKQHSDWPSAPDRHYDDWDSWLNLFNKEKPNFLTLEEFEVAIKTAGVDSVEKYRKEQKQQPTWPSNPDTHYSNWISWLGLFGREKPNFLTLEKLKIAVKAAGVDSKDKYLEIQKQQPTWPSNPSRHYDNCGSWLDLFGREKPNFLTLEKLKAAVKAAGVNSPRPYTQSQKQQPTWPSNPNTYYSNWTSWTDLFGREKANLLTLEKLKAAVKAAGVNSPRSYTQSQKQHLDWPSHPDRHYDGWGSWLDLFDKEKQ